MHLSKMHAVYASASSQCPMSVAWKAYACIPAPCSYLVISNAIQCAAGSGPTAYLAMVLSDFTASVVTLKLLSREAGHEGLLSAWNTTQVGT